MTNLLFKEVIYTLEIFGTVIFAISGTISAVRSGFDLTGAVLIACVVGVGGGTIRDLLIGAPVFWLTHWAYIVVAILTAIATLACMRYINKARLLILIFDAFGLGLFVIAGTQKALFYGLTPFLAIIMGLITGIGGGLIRDTLCNQKPLVLREEIYALAATAGALVFVLLPQAYRQNFFAYLGCSLIVVVIRLVSVRYHIHMPKIDAT